MTKPVRPREAVAHVKAVLRRLENRVLITARGAPTLDVSAEDIVVAGALRLDRRMRSVQLPDRTVVLTRMEFAIVEALATNRGRTLSREQLAGAIDPHGWDGYDRTIDSHVANLRKKIERNPASPELVVTVYGLGYKLNANG
jgi:DNA-binding response OmpR family regulator